MVLREKEHDGMFRSDRFIIYAIEQSVLTTVGSPLNKITAPKF